ncbi:MAG TPA: MFS transporter [Galbitalea sp.]|jgi:MFS family permease|nr:MFS transporter [Galbitalea sp.]
MPSSIAQDASQTEVPPVQMRRGLSRRATFWSASSVLALCLWASAAASVLYPIYAAHWHLPSVVVTSVFGTYPVALLLVLLFFGGVSDYVGRRRTMLSGILLIAVSAVLFAVAPNVGWLFAARALQGIGTGFAIGAASAKLVENNISANPRFPSSLTTASTATGLTLALVLSGILAQFAPLPLVLSFVLLFVLAIGAFIFVALTPDDRAGARTDRWRPAPVHVARGTVRPFIVATLSVAVAYTVGALFLSLGSSMAAQLTHTSNLAIIGATLALSSLCIGATALLIQRMHAHLAVVLGGVISIAGLVAMASTASSGSLGLLLTWAVVGGIGYSLAFTGGLSLLSRTAPPEHRGATLSLLYLFSYLFQAVAAIGAGALATAIGLGPAIGVVAPLVGLLCLAAIILAAVDFGARRRPATAPSPVARV